MKVGKGSDALMTELSNIMLEKVKELEIKAREQDIKLDIEKLKKSIEKEFKGNEHYRKLYLEKFMKMKIVGSDVKITKGLIKNQETTKDSILKMNKDILRKKKFKNSYILWIKNLMADLYRLKRMNPKDMDWLDIRTFVKPFLEISYEVADDVIASLRMGETRSI